MLFSEFVQINPSVSIDRGEKYPCVMMEEVEPGRKFVSGKRIKPFKGGAKFMKDDTLFARITPCLENGKIAKYTGKNGKYGFGSTEFFVFREIEDLSDSDYLYYFTLSDIIRKPAEASMFGASGRQRADLDVIKNIDFDFPPLPTQRKIACILSAYDDLIENNTRRIKILEEMAQRIYKEWFVDFRYPGHENDKLVDSELGVIPEGWQAKKTEEVMGILGGGTPSTKITQYWDDGTINWYSPKDLTKSNSMFILESGRKITELGLQKSSAKLFTAFSVMLTSRATIGVVSINTTEACTNQGFISCVPGGKLSAYQIYFWLLENVDMFKTLASGATFKELTKTTFRKFYIAIPPRNVSSTFNNFVDPIVNEILSLQKKQVNLRQTRDLLLPKLISGKVDVSKLKIRN